MPTRDANNSTWYVLRYATDFEPRAPRPDSDPVPPDLDARLFFDPDRHALELVPAAPDPPRAPAPGFAADLNGEAYRTVPGARRVVRVRCDGSEAPLGCGPNVFAAPAGLALDARGYLYVADPGAGRVVVVWPEDGAVVGAITDGLNEPVDVAASPCGALVAVADRAAGTVALFDARLRSVRAFPARNRSGLPREPEPVGIAFDDEGSVLVIDANYPRLLRFTACGEPLGDVPIPVPPPDAPPPAPPTCRDPVRPIRAPAARAAPADRRAPACRLAARHREYRLGLVSAAAAYPAEGAFLSAALDAGAPGARWHKVVVECDAPPGTEVRVETATAERPERLAGAPWASAGAPFAPERPDQLVQSEPGRFLRLRVALRSDGPATPSVRVIRVAYPRNSWLDLLPRVFARDPGAARFLERYLALFEHVFTRIGDRRALFLRQLTAASAPPDVLAWLGCLLDLAADPSWPLARRRALIDSAVELYRLRGTPEGVARFVEAYTGRRPVIREEFLDRPARPAVLGGRGSLIGCGFALRPAARDTRPDDELYAAYAHRFTVFAYLDGACDAGAALAAVDRIVAVNKPAHTAHVVRPVLPGARVGLETNLGIDFVLGEREPAGAKVAGADGMVLGRTGAVLGNRRPGTDRPPGLQL